MKSRSSMVTPSSSHVIGFTISVEQPSLAISATQEKHSQLEVATALCVASKSQRKDDRSMHFKLRL